ncbi:hypothetical protein C7S15_7721 [Burkholderia cepacia]|nr:hypothetical protein [Burkholderia cepacia]
MRRAARIPSQLARTDEVSRYPDRYPLSMTCVNFLSIFANEFTSDSTVVNK